MIKEAGLEWVKDTFQMFLKKDKLGSATLIIAKIIDDLLMAGRLLEMSMFVK